MDAIKIRKITRAGPCKEQIDVEIDRYCVEDTFDSVYKDINQEVTIAGFRRGKAPRQLLEKYYADNARKEAIKRLIANSYPAAVDKVRLNTIGQPNVSDAHFDDKGSFTYRVTVETWPSVKLGRYKGLVLKKPSFEITQEEIDTTLKRLAESHAQIDANKQRIVPAIDDEFAKDLGSESLESLKKNVKDEIAKAKELNAEKSLKEQLFEKLIRDSSFDIPEDLLQRQCRYHIERMKARLLISGVKEDEAEKEIAGAQDRIKENAKSQTRLFFILEEIARRENITVSEQELSQEIDYLAKQWHQNVVDVKRYFDKHGLWNEMVAEMRHNKVVELLLKEAGIEQEAI